jgi:hypothetical protein
MSLTREQATQIQLTQACGAFTVGGVELYLVSPGRKLYAGREFVHSVSRKNAAYAIRVATRDTALKTSVL